MFVFVLYNSVDYMSRLNERYTVGAGDNAQNLASRVCSEDRTTLLVYFFILIGCLDSVKIVYLFF